MLRFCFIVTGGVAIDQRHSYEHCVLRSPDVIWDPAVLLRYSRTSGGETAQSLGRKPGMQGMVMPCFLFLNGYILPKETKLLAGDLNKCISTVLSLHGIDLKPLPTLCYSLLLLAEFVFAISCLLQHDWSKQL